MEHFVYILKSTVDGSYYKGYTTDFERRLMEHNGGLSKYTAGKRPWIPVYLEKCDSKHAALIREKSLKRGNRRYFEYLANDEKNLLK
ncbi:GIY-YIG nuclease family protein [Chitinophaga terrae (ex Kim and Jung 2007)]|uniref:GIY-YIG nuclease family protein n=1 Tax=Chitinophaga terrae (ex Kim and Jung 2007) TaxID=408074 RepID=UPI000B7E555A|nr:GIY-YIG nuclease family protein [Chitinophaga terrae (ex Kim and Jung 2007)]